MQDRKARRHKGFIDKSVSFLAVGSLVACVVQFDYEPWFHGGRITKYEVDVLAIDPILVGSGTLLSWDEQQIADPNFRGDLEVPGHSSLKNPAEG
jgi:hypothetical protein